MRFLCRALGHDFRFAWRNDNNPKMPPQQVCIYCGLVRLGDGPPPYLTTVAGRKKD